MKRIIDIEKREYQATAAEMEWLCFSALRMARSLQRLTGEVRKVINEKSLLAGDLPLAQVTALTTMDELGISQSFV